VQQFSQLLLVVLLPADWPKLDKQPPSAQLPSLLKLSHAFSRRWLSAQLHSLPNSQHLFATEQQRSRLQMPFQQLPLIGPPSLQQTWLPAPLAALSLQQLPSLSPQSPHFLKLSRPPALETQAQHAKLLPKLQNTAGCTRFRTKELAKNQSHQRQ
jgi:hypothetical protein